LSLVDISTFARPIYLAASPYPVLRAGAPVTVHRSQPDSLFASFLIAVERSVLSVLRGHVASLDTDLLANLTQISLLIPSICSYPVSIMATIAGNSLA